MPVTRGGGLTALLLFLFVTGLPAATTAATLTATRQEDNVQIARFVLAPEDQWCVLWRHSVKGFEVADCYENQAGTMVLTRSYWPDAAAGLDHIPGRGRQISDGHGGYIILDINEPVPGNSYVLRPGTMKVDHRLQVGTSLVSLSAAAVHGRVRIALDPDPVAADHTPSDIPRATAADTSPDRAAKTDPALPSLPDPSHAEGARQ